MNEEGARKSNQRSYVQAMTVYQPDLERRWRSELTSAVDNPQLDRRSEYVMLMAICSVAHAPEDVIKSHIETALDAGSNVSELIEALRRVGAQEGIHALSSGGEALWEVITERDAAGVKVEAVGEPLGPVDLIPHSPWSPVRFPYHTPHPRNWRTLLDTYAPQRTAIEAARDEEIAALPKSLSRRMHEVLDVVIDSVVRWHEPRIDHHVHEALNCGSNALELVEMILSCAAAVQGAADGHISGRVVPTGLEITTFGLAALDRVKTQRDEAGVFTPMTFAVTMLDAPQGTGVG